MDAATGRGARLRVAVLIDYVAEAGGAEFLAVELMRRLDPTRFDAGLVVYRYDAPNADTESGDHVIRQLRREGFEVLELDGLSRLDLLSWRPLLRRLRAGRIDVLHTHKHGPNLWGALLSRLVRPPVLVAHEHTWSFEGNRKRVLADRLVVGTTADVVLAVSEADGRNLVDVVGIPEARVRVLPNGIPPVAPAPEETLRGELGIPLDAPLVGAVGGMRAQKDYPTLIAAHRLVLQRRPDAHLVIIGDGEASDRVAGLVDELDLRARVHLAGFRPDGAARAREFDIAVNSSTFEGASLAIAEFMETGRPIVATAVGGTPELLDEGGAGVLVPPSRPAALADAICSLLDDPERARHLGAAAAARQRERYDIGHQVERLEALYLELHAARGQGRLRRTLRRAAPRG